MKTKIRSLVAVLCAAALNVQAATITVTSTADSGAGTLRAALTGATNGDTIDASGVSGTILLTSGELLVTNNLTIIGPGPNNLAVDGNAASSVFHIPHTNTVVSISGLTITNGALGFGGGIYNGGILTLNNCTVNGNSRSGIYNDGSMAISNCTVSGNNGGATGYNDGGIGNGGSLSIVNSTIRDNKGRGISNRRDSGGTAVTTVSNCTVSGNSGTEGGGIANNGYFGGYAVATIANSTISGNSTTNVGTGAGGGGGGIFNGPGEVTLTNCTVSGNSANGLGVGGGGIYNAGYYGLSGSVTIANSTLSSNSAGYAGGIYNNYGGGSAYLTIVSSTLNDSSISDQLGNIQIGDTIMKAGASGPSIDSATATSLGYNLSSDDGGGFLTATGDQINTDPKLGPLQNNGGPTFTHALLRGSPAIDKGKNFSGSATDQRGRPRTYDNPAIPNAAGGDGTDIGAFEFIPPALAIARNFGNVVLSWSTNDPGYTVESTAVLANSGNWTTVPGTPLVIGGQYLLGDGPVTGNKFYRLRSP